MAAKTQHRTKRQPRRPADTDERKRQAAMAADKRMKTGGRGSRARLAALTAELDTRRADVYTTVRRAHAPAAHPPHPPTAAAAARRHNGDSPCARGRRAR